MNKVLPLLTCLVFLLGLSGSVSAAGWTVGSGGDAWSGNVIFNDTQESVFTDYVIINFTHVNEDLTTYIETDPNSKITVNSTTAEYVNLSRIEDAYVYYDKGVDYFDGDFEHLFTMEVTSADNLAQVNHWGLTNTVDDSQGIDNAGGDELHIFYKDAGTTDYIRLRENVGGTLYTDHYIASKNTVYYITVRRDESVGTYGTLYAYIYSDPERTNLLDTLSLALHEKEDFRYVFALQTHKTGSKTRQSGYTSDLDLQDSYKTSGNLTSIVKDAESIGSVGDVWYKIQIQGANTSGTWFHGYWNYSTDDVSYSLEDLGNLTTGVNYPVTNARYGSLIIEFNTNDSTKTPELYNITFYSDYFNGSVEPTTVAQGDSVTANATTNYNLTPMWVTFTWYSQSQTVGGGEYKRQFTDTSNESGLYQDTYTTSIGDETGNWTVMVEFITSDGVQATRYASFEVILSASEFSLLAIPLILPFFIYVYMRGRLDGGKI